MKPIRLRINKKTLVPTKNAIIHPFRSDWKTVGIIDYPDSRQLFKNIDGHGPIHTDAQFAHWILQHFGTGTYYCQCWIKGREGFFNFFFVECMKDRYCRLQKEVKKTDMERREFIAEYRRIKKRADNTHDSSEKSELKEEMERIQDDLSITKELIELEKPEKSGPYPYLKSKQPVYKEHEYTDIDSFSQETEQTESEVFQEIW